MRVLKGKQRTRSTNIRTLATVAAMRGPNVSARTRARQLRRDATDVERRLWRALSNRQIEGRKFVRQMPIGPFFADFACREVKLAIELDGGQHATSATDAARTAYLEQHGYRVLRFWNVEVIDDIDSVVQAIVAAVTRWSPEQRPSPSRRCAAGPSLSPLKRGEVEGIAP